MKLYGFPPSPNTWKVRAFAHHIGVPLEFELVDLSKRAQRQPGYLARNPTGRTPTLVDGDFTLWESSAILNYLANTTPGPHEAKDARTRADIARWHCWQLAHLAPACGPYLFERLVKGVLGLGAPDEARVAAAEPALHAEAKVLDQHLASRSHIVGTAPTTADFAVIGPFLYSERARMPLGDYANLMRWRTGIMALPCWAATAPQM